MIGYGNSLMPPFCGKRNYLVHSAGRVHCRHLGVQMQLHTLVLGGIHAAFDVAAVNIHGEHAVIPRIGVIPIVASDQKGGSVALSFFQQGYGSLLLHRLRKELDSDCIGLIRYENGASTLLKASYALNCEPAGGRTLYGTKGGLCLDNMKLYTNINGFMTDSQIIDTASYIDAKPMFDAEIDHFVDCCLGRCECMSKAEDGVVIMKILDALYESARTGHEAIID